MDATRPTEVPVPEPDLKPEEMIARARALRSMVREEAEAAERRGYYSEALHNEFVKAGIAVTVEVPLGATSVSISFAMSANPPEKAPTVREQPSGTLEDFNPSRDSRILVELRIKPRE